MQFIPTLDQAEVFTCILRGVTVAIPPFGALVSVSPPCFRGKYSAGKAQHYPGMCF